MGLGSLPIVGDLFGGGGGGGSFDLGGMLNGALGGILGGGGSRQAAPQQAPMTGPAWSGYPQTQGPAAYPGWPVPGPGPQPTYQFQGDFSKPGAAESFFSNNQDKFGAPTQSGDYWKQNATRFGAPGQGDQFWNQAQGMFNAQKPGSNRADEAYQQFQASAPANTAPYYDRAADLAMKQATGSAARAGLLGNSATQEGMNDILANIRGQQALADANYGLQRGQVAGSLGAGADLSSRGISQNQLGWMQGLGSLGLGLQNSDLSRLMGGAQVAGNADQLGLAQLMAGVNASNAAQAAARMRGQDYFNNQMALAAPQVGILGNTYGQMLGSDQDLFNSQMGAMLGLPREQLNQSLGGRANTEQGIGNLFSLAGSFMGGMGL